MVTSQQETTMERKHWALPVYLTSEPVLIAALSVLAIISILAVSGLSRLYHRQQESLGNRWFQRGLSDENTHNYNAAMLEFRTALRYSLDNYDYQLHLAHSLIGLGRTREAYTYLINLWEREPENGMVNLALARISAQNGQTERALRYYHNAIYATWPGDRETQRRETRVELIEYLLKINANEQAQSELIALAANLGDDPGQQLRVGDLFMRAQDYDHALAAYRATLKTDHHNEAALAGAGLAAFQLGQYPLAYRYLQQSVSTAPQDNQSAALLKTTELVLQMDPFQRQISAAHRNRIVVESFETAGDRLKACGVQPSAAAEQKPAGSSSQPVNASGPSAKTPSTISPTAANRQPAFTNLADTWEAMKPRITERNLERDPDLVESAMDLVFEIERDTAATCGLPVGADQALLLISKLHEGR